MPKANIIDDRNETNSAQDAVLADLQERVEELEQLLAEVKKNTPSAKSMECTCDAVEVRVAKLEKDLDSQIRLYNNHVKALHC